MADGNGGGGQTIQSWLHIYVQVSGLRRTVDARDFHLSAIDAVYRYWVTTREDGKNIYVRLLIGRAGSYGAPQHLRWLAGDGIVYVYHKQNPLKSSASKKSIVFSDDMLECIERWEASISRRLKVLENAQDNVTKKQMRCTVRCPVRCAPTAAHERRPTPVVITSSSHAFHQK